MASQPAKSSPALETKTRIRVPLDQRRMTLRERLDAAVDRAYEENEELIEELAHR